MHAMQLFFLLLLRLLIVSLSISVLFRMSQYKQ